MVSAPGSLEIGWSSPRAAMSKRSTRWRSMPTAMESSPVLAAMSLSECPARALTSRDP